MTTPRRKGSKREQEKDAAEGLAIGAVRRSLLDSEKLGLVTLRPQPAVAEEVGLRVLRYLWADGFNVVRRAR